MTSTAHSQSQLTGAPCGKRLLETVSWQAITLSCWIMTNYVCVWRWREGSRGRGMVHVEEDFLGGGAEVFTNQSRDMSLF